MPLPVNEDLRLSEDQRDALQEVANIGMGQAGSALAQLLDTFVALSVPRIQLVRVTELGKALADMVDSASPVTAVRQSFQCDIRGEAIVIYGREGTSQLWDLMGYEATDEPDAAAERELLVDVANVLVGACICNVFEQLGRSLSFSKPTVIGENVPVEYLLQPSALSWKVALLVEVNFSLRDRQFTSHLLTLMPEESIQQMKRALDHFLANL
ncbi:MAG: chemotaxis protein CheC [Pseudomonadota bacterium]